MAGILPSPTALVLPCFVAPVRLHPKLQVNPQLRHRQAQNLDQKAAPTTSAAICLSLAAGATAYGWRTQKSCGMLQKRCSPRDFQDESAVLIAEARKLRVEVAKLEQEQARMAKRSELDLVVCCVAQHQQEIIFEPVQQESTPGRIEPDVETESSMRCRPEMLDDCDQLDYRVPVMDHSLRLLAALPYLIPALDAWRSFGIGIASEAWPTLYAEWLALAGLVPQDFQHACGDLSPVLILAMPQIAVRRRLPELLRFNLNQAFLLSLAAWCAFHASSWAHWLAVCHEDALYVPASVQPPILPGGHAVLPLLAACIVYSVYATLSTGSLPDKIPYVSAEAKKSLGTSPSVAKEFESAGSGWSEPTAQSHKIEDGSDGTN